MAMYQSPWHYVADYDTLTLGCGQRRATGYAESRVTTKIHSVDCQKCMAAYIFKAECARQEVTIWTGDDGLLHLNDRRLEQAYADSLALGVPLFGSSRFRFDRDEVHMTVTAFQALIRAAVTNPSETP